MSKPIAKSVLTVTLYDDGTFLRDLKESATRPTPDVRPHIASLRAATVLAASQFAAQELTKDNVKP